MALIILQLRLIHLRTHQITQNAYVLVNRFDNPYTAPMETCVFVVEFGALGYNIRCANSRMRAVHDRIGYYPLPDGFDTLLSDHIILPNDLAVRG